MTISTPKSTGAAPAPRSAATLSMTPGCSVVAWLLIASAALVPSYAPAQQARSPSNAASTTAPPANSAPAQEAQPPAGAPPAQAPSADSAADPTSGTSALNNLLAPTGITATGYLAASYYYSTDDSTYHEFDTAHDTLQIDQAAITLAYQPKEGFGALVNLMAGEDARFINEQQNGTHGSFDVTQAFLQYAKGPLTVIGGRFLTLVGAESESPALNTNFSRSLVYFAEPITHTGVRATYAATDTVSVIVGVNEGWNTISNSYGSKTGEFSLQYTPNKIVAFSAQGYVGKDSAYDATRTLIDLIATYNATASLTFILNYDWGQQQQRPVMDAARPSLNWNAVAGYVNYAFDSEWRISLRGEVLDDQGGFVTGTPETIEEGTVTLGYAPIKSFEARLEARYDTSNQATFEYKTPNTATFDSHQTGFALQGVYKF